MAERERFEVLVLGSGSGGQNLAWHMARSGRRTAVVEREWIGGSCRNVNCLPSKNVIWSAKVADLTHHGERFGVMTDLVTIDMTKLRQRKRDMVERIKALTLQAYKESGAELILGKARFVAPKTLEVGLDDGGTRTMVGDQVFIDLGTRAIVPNIPGLVAAAPMTNIEALELGYVPSHLIVLGGGYVGLELGQAYRRLGSRVTIIEQGPHILGPEDSDVVDEMRRILSNEKIDILETTQTRSVEGRSGKDVSFFVRTPSGEQTIAGSDILVATGRMPNTSGIGLDVAGIALDDRGYVKVNERLETSASEVWAIGEGAGSPQFTNASYDDFRVIRDNLAGGNRTTRNRLLSYSVFTDPQLARVGFNEGEAQRQGIQIRIAKLPMGAVLRAHTFGETQGFMKALVAANDDRILGFTMIGPEASEAVAAVHIAMLAGLPYSRLRDAILAHPTMAEGVGRLFLSVSPASV
jgi:pyruvate/2-oxoglutarate dehydrogenase complex dihydrolipoamide dehydrogenase (E3) component